MSGVFRGMELVRPRYMCRCDTAACDALRQAVSNDGGRRYKPLWSDQAPTACMQEQGLSVPRFGAKPTAALLARSLRSLATLAALTLGLLLWAEDADARLDGELSFAAAGASALTPQAVVAALLDELVPGMAALADDATPRAAAQPGAPNGTLVGLFSRPGLLGGFAAGFLGAGLLGLLFGQGVTGGLTGIAAVLGLIFQLTLILILVRLIWTWWHGDKTSFANLSPRQLADAYGSPRHEKLPAVDSPATAESALSDPPASVGSARERPRH